MKRKWLHPPYQRIAELYCAGLTTVEIAKAIDRYQEHAVDPTKSLRVLISMMINDGYVDQDGQFVYLTKKPVITGKRTTK